MRPVPSTSSRLLSTEPSSETCTTRIRPSFSAKMAMMSSGALPMDAFMSPAKVSFTCSASSSVAKPSRSASGSMASSESTKVAPAGQPMFSLMMARGTKTSSTLNHGRSPGSPKNTSWQPWRSDSGEKKAGPLCAFAEGAATGPASAGGGEAAPASMVGDVNLRSSVP